MDGANSNENPLTESAGKNFAVAAEAYGTGDVVVRVEVIGASA